MRVSILVRVCLNACSDTCLNVVCTCIEIGFECVFVFGCVFVCLDECLYTCSDACSDTCSNTCSDATRIRVSVRFRRYLRVVSHEVSPRSSCILGISERGWRRGGVKRRREEIEIRKVESERMRERGEDQEVERRG